MFVTLITHPEVIFLRRLVLFVNVTITPLKRGGDYLVKLFFFSQLREIFKPNKAKRIVVKIVISNSGNLVSSTF